MRWLFRIGGAILALVVIAVAVVLLIPAERVAKLAADRFEAMTGRALHIEGGVSPRFWPVLGIKTGAVSISNADWSQVDGPMFTAEGLTVAINASSLLGGEVRILGVEMQKPKILVERAKDGRLNWDLSQPLAADAAPSAATGPGTQGFTLERGEIANGVLRYVDHASKREVTLDAVNLTLAIPDYAGPFTLDATGVSSGQKLGVKVKGEVFSAFAEGRVVPLSLSATVGAAQLAFNGRAGLAPLAAEGDLESDLTDLNALGALAGTAIAKPPQGFGAERLTLSGKVSLDQKGTIYLRGARIETDNNLLFGDLDLSQGAARPKIAGNLRAESLNLSGLSGGEGGGASGGMKAEGWPTEVLDVSALGVVDAALTLGAGTIDLGAAKLGESKMVLTIDRARAVFDIREMAAYGGAVTGEFVVNGRGGLSAGGTLSLAGIQTQPLLTDLSGWDRLISQGNLTLKFLAVGNSMDALMKSLEGSGQMSLGKGELRGLDIGGMLRSLDTSYVGEGQKTIFDGIAGSFTMQAGNLQTSDLQFIAPYLTAAGQGRIGIGARDLDFRLRPTAFAGEDGTGGVMVPLRITGPWAKPTYRLDLESIAREKMEAEAKEVEARAKAALEAKLKAELGVEAQAGESLEDATKRRAREAVEKEADKLLKGLLGGN